MTQLYNFRTNVDFIPSSPKKLCVFLLPSVKGDGMLLFQAARLPESAVGEASDLPESAAGSRCSPSPS